MKRYILPLMAIFSFGTAQAEEGFYYGFGVGLNSAKSESEFAGVNSDGKFASIGGTAGYRFEKSSVFFGPELDMNVALRSEFADTAFGTNCSAGANGPYYCSVKGTLRLRGVLGTTLANGNEVFGTLGVAAVFGDSAVEPLVQDTVINTGFTVGFGAQRNLQNGNKLRAELIFDRLNTVSKVPTDAVGIEYFPKYQSVTAKVTYLFN